MGEWRKRRWRKEREARKGSRGSNLDWYGDKDKGSNGNKGKGKGESETRYC